jgi:hypothetical protein
MPVRSKNGLRLAFGGVAAAVFAAFALSLSHRSASADGGGGDSVSAHLGGYEGILSFLHNRAVPAVLADATLAPFFSHLTVAPTDIEECLARLLDHDLGGESAKNGETTSTGHECRSSMSNVHRGLAIPDSAFTRFIQVVGAEAQAAGVPADDIAAVAKALERYRGSIRNK